MVYLSHQQLYEPRFSSGNAKNVASLLSNVEFRTSEVVQEEQLEASDCLIGGQTLKMPAKHIELREPSAMCLIKLVDAFAFGHMDIVFFCYVLSS